MVKQFGCVSLLLENTGCFWVVMSTPKTSQTRHKHFIYESLCGLVVRMCVLDVSMSKLIAKHFSSFFLLGKENLSSSKISKAQTSTTTDNNKLKCVYFFLL